MIYLNAKRLYHDYYSISLALNEIVIHYTIHTCTQS